MKSTAAAPGKIILTGEHFVVYGEPAVVMAIDRFVRVTVWEGEGRYLHVSSDLGYSGAFKDGEYKAEKGGFNGRRILEPVRISAQAVLNALDERVGLKIEVNSSIPTAAGLGSSGALAVATVTAVGKFLGTGFSEEEILALSTEAERFVHVNPSGIDQAVSTYGGVMVYSRDLGLTRIRTDSVIPLVIGDTGVKRSTGRLVDLVGAKRERFPKLFECINDAARCLSQRFVEGLKKNNLSLLGELMDVNHGLLASIGVSNQALDRLIYAAKRSGALGGKLTGAGGGGCMIALTMLEDRERVSEGLRREGGTPIPAKKSERGVNCWICQ